jgi:hypothetical protein
LNFVCLDPRGKGVKTGDEGSTRVDIGRCEIWPEYFGPECLMDPVDLDYFREAAMDDEEFMRELFDVFREDTPMQLA